MSTAVSIFQYLSTYYAVPKFCISANQIKFSIDFAVFKIEKSHFLADKDIKDLKSKLKGWNEDVKMEDNA